MNQNSAGVSGLTLSNLTLKKEGTYFMLVLVFSALVWLAVAVSVIGLFYAGLFALLAWFGNGLLIAYLRAESVKISAEQLPELHANLQKACATLGITDIPDLYVVQSGGMLNAFATRFSGRSFVVVYSDLLETFGPASPEMTFILGHELGHLKSNHIWKRIVGGPGMLVPLLGAAYSRACEASCDRHGAFVTGNKEASQKALLVLAGGRLGLGSFSPASFLDQHRVHRGFFVSLHELTSGYPTLSKRLWLLEDADENRRDYARHPLAYFFAFFIPNGGVNASSNLLIAVVIIGMMAAMALPAFEKVRQNSLHMACSNNQRMIQGAYQQYALSHNETTTNLALLQKEFIGGKPLRCGRTGTYTIVPLDDGDCDVECSEHGSLLHQQ